MKIEIVMKSVLEGPLGQIKNDDLAKEIINLIKQEEKKENQKILQDSPQKTTEFILNMINKLKAGKTIQTYSKFDENFNNIVAGIMGSTCYMKDNFDKLYKKTEESILRIANIVLTNGHHSTFGHSHLTLQISDIPKALAMVLNNEKEYNTSEKSARYTVMKDIDPKNNALYEKWIEIFNRKITEEYGNKSAFFDEKGIKAKKLSQENARYLIPVTTKTSMVYTTSFRQLNYICHWLENEIEKPSNPFYSNIKDDMIDFVYNIKNLGLYVDELEDGKDRQLSLFGKGIIENNFSNTYQQEYQMSLACLAQSQRHRTINYNIVEKKFDIEKANVYVPPILNNDKKLTDEFVNDFNSVRESIPQGMMVDCAERGSIESFILKAKERQCSMAQKEIRDRTFMQSKEYNSALLEKKKGFESIIASKYIKQSYKDEIKEKLENIDELIQEIEPLTKGARCLSGYECKSPCGFKEGIELESRI